jgi:hypothetical protein
MRYVILRDDDTNALTPIECLERLYRPFLEHGLPVNLATIPNVNTAAEYEPGQPELFLLARNGVTPSHLPLASNQKLVDYLLSNPGYRVIQHGCRHESVHNAREFNHHDRDDIVQRLEEGARCLTEAGFPKPRTFVAPYDQFSRTGFEEVSKRYRVISAGWYELGRLPVSWWPQYAWKKTSGASHWRVGQTTFLSHPGCHLSYHKAYERVLDSIKASIDSQKLTVLVTHWWEYFRYQQADERLIAILHETAHYLAHRPDVQVLSFDDLAEERIELN